MEYRVELKYLVSERQLVYLQKQLKPLMTYDRFHPDGRPYGIRSLYFDDLYDTCLQENEDSTDYREKFRIRIYNGENTVIHLETKEKVHGYTRKKKEDLTYEDCLLYLKKEVPPLKKEDGLLKKKLYACMQLAHYQPVQIVDYERIAMVEPKGNVRITFDRNIAGTSRIDTFFDKIPPLTPALLQGMHILEVKYDEFLPDSIRKVLGSISLNRVSFSKYYYTRKNELINWEN